MIFITLLIIFFYSNTFIAESRSEQKWVGEYYDVHSNPQFEAAVDIISKLHVSDYSSILDIGCGSGKVTDVIAKLAPKSKIEAVDASESMISAAQKKYCDRRNINFNVCSAENLSYCGRFDLIVSFACFHWIPDKEQAFKAISKSLKPGGSVFVMALGKDSRHPLLRSFNDLKKSKEWKNLLSSVDPKTQHFPLERFQTRKLLNKTGFKSIDVKEVRRKVRFKNSQDFGAWLVGWLGGLSAVAKLKPEEQKVLVKAIVDRYKHYVPEKPDGSIEFVWPQIIAKAKKPKHTK